MSCNASKAPIFRAIAQRGYAAIACPRPVGDTAAVNVKVAENKVVVATADSAVPATRISLVFRAGSRNESYDIRGASHILRLATGLSTEGASSFAITRNIQQAGGTLTSWGDREVVGYTLQTSADNIEKGLRYLQDLVKPSFKPWEVSRLSDLLRTHLEEVTPQERAVELAHQAAFRTGLGNSIYIPKYQIGKISSESLLHFAKSNITASRTAVVGVGIDNNSLVGFAQTLDLPTEGGGKQDGAHYYGGDARIDTAGHAAHVAVVGQGTSITNHKESLAFAILEKALGGGSCIKRGKSGGAFNEAAACAVGETPIAYKPINVNYSDTGLFGFVVSADTKDIGKLVDAMTIALKSGAITPEDVKRGKALLKAEVQNTFSSDSELLEELGKQAAINRTVLDADTLVAAIDGITQQQVQEAAKKVASSKISVGAIGHLVNVPYASELA